jgi:hypothetical protein
LIFSTGNPRLSTPVAVTKALRLKLTLPQHAPSPGNRQRVNHTFLKNAETFRLSLSPLGSLQ